MAWYTSNSDRQERRLQAEQAQRERHSATDGGTLAFEKFGNPVKLPVPMVRPRPGRARPVPASVRNREAGLKRMREEARQRRIERLKALKTVGTTVANVTRRNPYGFAFQLGWRIGTLIFHREVGDETVGSEGYELVPGGGAVWHTCTDGPPPCILGAYSYYYANESPPTCFGVAQLCSSGAGGTLVQGHGTPWAAYTNAGVGSGTVVAARKVTTSGYWFRIGDWFTPIADPVDPRVQANWTQTLVPGFGTTVETVPAEQPDLWPMHAPVRLSPQKWADAVPKPGQQERTRPRQRLRFSVPPMVPFPVVLVDTQTVPAPLRPPIVSIGTKVGVRDRMKVRWKQNDAKRKRTGKRRKEIKLNVVSVAPRLWALINVATETQDFLEAMHKGLPKECRSKGKKGTSGKRGKVPPHVILRDMWDCWDHFDGAKALTAFINNQFEDFVYGKIGKAGAKASRNLKLTTGLQSAVRQHQQRINDLRDQEGKDALMLQLPQLKYDADADEWSIDLGGG